MTSEDHFFMEEALKEAQKGFENDEVPVGAVLVHQNKIIARAHNQVESLQDATAHAEILCLQKGSRLLGNWRLLEITLYCTLEPCPMCAGAMILSRVKRLVWGTPDLRQGACGSLFHVLDVPHPIHEIEIEKNVLEEQSAALLKEFFVRKRKCKKFLKSSSISNEKSFSRVLKD
jgi:tRNA(adenine34) deaminase